MAPVVDESQLIDALNESQRLGFLGDRPIAEVIEHARSFVAGLRALDAGCRVIDLGSGGGVPGLVIAHDRPDLDVTLLDRRTKRTDFLERMIRRLGWQARVSVIAADIVAFDPPRRFDAAVARGFGPPLHTLRSAVSMVSPGGLVVISEPPEGDRWDPVAVAATGAERLPSPDAAGRVAVFRRRVDA